MTTIQVVEKNVVVQHPKLDEPLTVTIELEVSHSDCVCALAPTPSPGTRRAGDRMQGEASNSQHPAARSSLEGEEDRMAPSIRE